MSLKLVWNIADTLNAMMAFPNLIALLVESCVIVSETKKYLWDGNLDAWSTDEIPTLNK